MRLLLLCLREARIAVQVMFALRLVTAAALSSPGGRGLASWPALLGIAAWSCAVFFVYLLNGVTDIDEDRINGSKRPIASGLLTPRQAIVVARGAALLALVCAAVHGVALLVPLVALMLLGYGYSAPSFAWKSRTNTAMAVVLASGLLTYFAGWVVAQEASSRVPVLVFAAAMTAWMGLVGTLAKDFSDVEGDAAAGRRSVLVTRGQAVARTLCGANALAVGGAFVVCAAFLAPVLLWPAVIVLLGAVWLAGTLAYGEKGSTRRPYQVFMIVQHAAHTAALVLAVQGERVA
jgi:4-hydroxybenzoate polyprenyltransferase